MKEFRVGRERSRFRAIPTLATMRPSRRWGTQMWATRQADVGHPPRSLHLGRERSRFRAMPTLATMKPSRRWGTQMWATRRML